MSNYSTAFKRLVVDVATLQDKHLAAAVAALIVSATTSLFGLTLTTVEVTGALVVLGSIAKVIENATQPADPAPVPAPAPVVPVVPPAPVVPPVPVVPVVASQTPQI